MAYFKQECKLCDNIINDENFKVIKDIAKDVFDMILLKLTLIDTQNVICNTCYSKLIAALNFKTKCLYTDNTIIPYVEFNNPKLDLKQIYAKEKGSKQGGSMLEDREVCRLCMEPVSGDHKSIQEVPVGSIDIYIPEINFESTTNPVICIECYDALHVHSTFIKNWADLDKRNGYAENCGEIFLNDQSIKIEQIEFKSEETDEDMLFETPCDINKEEHDERDTSLQSLTDLTYTEENKSMYECGHRKQTSAQSTFANNQSEECSFQNTSGSRSADHERRHKRVSEGQANNSNCNNRNSKRRCLTRGLKVQDYQCDKCSYNTKNKGHFMQHQLIHKDPSEVQMHECDKCLYRSIRKNDLKRHQLGHKDPSEVLVFQCDQCDYKSKQKVHLKQHQLRHKDPSEVQMYKCDKCKFETKHKSTLVKHCLTHKDPSEVRMMFNCDECDYTSIHKSALNLHQLKHKDPAEVQMFKCDQCDYKSTQKGNLKRHELRHKDPSEVRMFQCDKCDYKAIRKAHLKQHQLRHKYPSEGQL